MSGYHALHWAVVSEHINALRYLTPLFDVNVKSHTGITALHLAAGLGTFINSLNEAAQITEQLIVGKTEAVRFLAELNSPSVEELDSKQRTAIDVAVENAQQATIDVMRQAVLLSQLGGRLISIVTLVFNWKFLTRPQQINLAPGHNTSVGSCCRCSLQSSCTS